MEGQQNCLQCEAVLADDGRQRKRNRPRRCQKCNSENATKRRRESPVLMLAHRWNNSCRRLYKNPPPSLWSPATVKAVLERCEYKSVISGTTDHELLCIFPFFMDRTKLPRVDQLVILTSREAQSVSKAKTQEERAARFPAAISAQMH